MVSQGFPPVREIADRSDDFESARRDRVAIACANVNRYGGVFADRRIRTAVAIARKYSTGDASAEAVFEAVEGVKRASAEAAERATREAWTLMEVRRAASARNDRGAADTVVETLGRAIDPHGCLTSIPVFHSRWITPDVANLARSAQRNPHYGLLPLLADALEEAGCDEPAILRHCREPIEHAPGCRCLRAILAAVSSVSPDKVRRDRM